jgi:hypothetical protein
MLKDIPQIQVKDVAVAVIPEESSSGEPGWAVYLINLKDESLNEVLITSKGYGYYEGEKVNTSVLRHYIETLPPHGFARIEMILENILGLHNEFWVSFFIDKVMYDKKYLFLAESIQQSNFTKVPLINKSGVMIQ